MLEVCLLGTGGMMPLPYRWLTAMMARYNGTSILIDCGEGTQVALKQKGWSPNPIDVICFTHFHADHISGLPGMLLTMGNAERTEPLTIIGPKGVQQVVPAGVGGVGNNIEGVGLGVEEAVGAGELEVVDALALKGEEHCVAETVVLVHVEIHIAFVEGIVGEDGVGAAAEGVDVEQQFGESERGWVAEPVLAILPIEVCAIIGGVVPVARPERDGHGVAR